MIDSGALSYRQVRVGALAIGMIGLDELFAALLQQGRQPDGDMAAELLQGARRHNYISPAGEADSADALLREYRRYCEGQSGTCGCATGYGTWRGRPRETVPWYPTVHADLCNGCGACLRFCSFGVYTADDDGRVQVVEPFRCQVGCSACARICQPGAIAFPPATLLEAYHI
jgi:NAD-dependent dihydropyrimidine dehydrogenase PreA subunit